MQTPGHGVRSVRLDHSAVLQTCPKAERGVEKPDRLCRCATRQRRHGSRDFLIEPTDHLLKRVPRAEASEKCCICQQLPGTRSVSRQRTPQMICRRPTVYRRSAFPRCDSNRVQQAKPTDLQVRVIGDSCTRHGQCGRCSGDVVCESGQLIQ